MDIEITAVENGETVDELQSAIKALQAKLVQAKATEEGDEVEKVRLPIADVRLKINRNQDVVVKGITPPELAFLVAEHHGRAGGLPVVNIDLVKIKDDATKNLFVDVDPRVERSRLEGKYNVKKIRALFPGMVPSLPKSFRTAMNSGLEVVLPSERLVDYDLAAPTGANSMARGTALATLRQMVRAEVVQTMDTSAATQTNNNVNQMLANKQLWLTATYDWPFLEQRWDLTCPPTTRYKAMPTAANTPVTSATLNQERPFQVEVLFNNFYRPLQYGIGMPEYNIRNPELLQYSDPFLNWRQASNVTDTNVDYIELWPVNVTTQTVRFTGQRRTTVLFNPAVSATTNDAYKADLDDLLLVLMVAADILLGQGAPEAQLKAAMARERLAQLRSNYPQNDEPIVFGQSRKLNREFRRTVPMIVVAP